MQLRTRGWRSTWLAVAGILPLMVLGGCNRPAGSPAPAGDAAQEQAAQSQAERTKQIEEKARELDRRAAEIQNMQGTEQEKIDAVNKLEQERQELNKAAGDGAAPAAQPQQ